jgi:hypothetical protein
LDHSQQSVTRHCRFFKNERTGNFVFHLGSSTKIWQGGTRMCPKVSGLTAWSENCKWYSYHYVQLYRYFVSQSSKFCCHNPSCYFSTSNTKGKRKFLYRLSPETFGYTRVHWLKTSLYQLQILFSIKHFADLVHKCSELVNLEISGYRHCSQVVYIAANNRIYRLNPPPRST